MINARSSFSALALSLSSLVDRMIVSTRRLRDSPFIGKAFTVLSGAALAQIVNVAAAPVVARVYSPESYGLLGAVMSIVTLLNVVAAMSFPVAIVLPKSDDDARAISALSVVCGVTTAALFCVCVLPFRAAFAHLLGVEPIADILFALPALMIFESVFQAGQYWMIRTEQYSLTARVLLAQAIASALLKIVGGLIWPSPYMLVAGSLLSVPISAVAFYFLLNRSPASPRWPGLHTARRLAALAASHKDFALYRAPHTLVWSLNQSLPALLMVRLFDIRVAGLYSMSNALVNLPAQILMKAINDVFLPQLTRRAQDHKPILSAVTAATAALIAVGALCCVAFVFIAPWLLSSLLGPKWAAAGEYAQWLSLLAVATIASAPSYCAVTVMRIQDRLLGFEIFSIAVRAGALWLGAGFNDGSATPIAIFVVSGVVVQMLFIIAVSFACRRFDSERGASFGIEPAREQRHALESET